MLDMLQCDSTKTFLSGAKIHDIYCIQCGQFLHLLANTLKRLKRYRLGTLYPNVDVGPFITLPTYARAKIKNVIRRHVEIPSDNSKELPGEFFLRIMFYAHNAMVPQT